MFSNSLDIKFGTTTHLDHIWRILSGIDLNSTQEGSNFCIILYSISYFCRLSRSNVTSHLSRRHDYEIIRLCHCISWYTYTLVIVVTLTYTTDVWQWFNLTLIPRWNCPTQGCLFWREDWTQGQTINPSDQLHASRYGTPRSSWSSRSFKPFDTELTNLARYSSWGAEQMPTENLCTKCLLVLWLIITCCRLSFILLCALHGCSMKSGCCELFAFKEIKITIGLINVQF